MLLPTDIFKEILLNSDIYTISNLSITNKEINKLCNDKQLWVTQFNNNNFPHLYKILPITVGDWIKEYKYVNSSYKISQNFNEFIKINVNSFISLKEGWLSKLLCYLEGKDIVFLPKIKGNYNLIYVKSRLYIEISMRNNNQFKKLQCYDNNCEYIDENITESQLTNMITIIFYYYYAIDSSIIEQLNISYNGGTTNFYQFINK